jgi:hypothetical protein
MYLRSTSRSLLAATMAASLLAATPALARTADEGSRATVQTSSLAGTVSPGQDLRGEHARDAARLTPAPITRAAAPAAQPAKALPATDDDGGRAQTWLIVLVGLAGAAIAAGGTASVRSHRHA